MTKSLAHNHTLAPREAGAVQKRLRSNANAGVTDNESTSAASLNLDWSSIATFTAEAVSLLAPLVAIAEPEAAAGINIAAKILIGVLDGVPEAIAIWNRIKSGEQPTQQELIDYANSYEAAYQQLNTDIAAAQAAQATSS